MQILIMFSNRLTVNNYIISNVDNSINVCDDLSYDVLIFLRSCIYPEAQPLITKQTLM